jgi:integrase
MPVDQQAVTMAGLMNAYWKFAKGYYVKNGKPTDTQAGIKAALKVVRRFYGHTLAVDFGPLALKAIQKHLVEADLSRRYINDHTERIRRMFRWAASEEMIPASIVQALDTVPGLRKGRTKARETGPVLPVADAVVQATLAELPVVVADMVQFQRFTGCRPGEVCAIRPRDIDISSEIWEYRPESHKTEHLGRGRVVFIGPKAQNVLRPYLLRDETAYCFSPMDSERRRRRDRHEERSTPLTYGNRPGTNRKRKPRRSAGNRYSEDSYRRAIHRACDKAFAVPVEVSDSAKMAWRKQHRWSPNRLRHTAATEIRQHFGLEAARVVLGHSSVDVTELYAEQDSGKAAEIMRKIG